MINQVSKAIFLFLVTIFAVAGCEQQHKEVVAVPLYEHLLDPNFVIPDYASGAIEATGGKQAWAKVKKLEFDCVVTFYQPDDSFYLTEHHYEIHPWTNSIRITAREPLNKFVWQLSEGRFSMLEADKQNDISPVAGFYRDFAETILNIITAPIRFLDEKTTFTKLQSMIKREGFWYQPIQQTNRNSDTAVSTEPAKPYWSKVIFYQNKENSLVDTILFADSVENKFLAVRGYDYTEVDKKGVRVPIKIEVFKTDAQGSFQQLLAEINFK
jgi:hypothetical protein